MHPKLPYEMSFSGKQPIFVLFPPHHASNSQQKHIEKHRIIAAVSRTGLKKTACFYNTT
jgi:hypothetical protein